MWRRGAASETTEATSSWTSFAAQAPSVRRQCGGGERLPSAAVPVVERPTLPAGLCLAAKAKELHGWDIVPEAVRDARANAERNGVANAMFHLGDLKSAAGAIGKKVPSPDVIVVDPARAGMAPALVGFLRASGARRLVYVSCNPPTQARDLKLLCAEGGVGVPYRLLRVTPVDMFPQTSHIEAVAVLTR